MVREEVSKSQNQINAFLGAGTAFKGNIQFSGTVRIDGEFEGSIEGDGTLLLGQTSRIQANITIGSISVGGLLKGDIVAINNLRIQSSAKVYGNISTPSLVIEEGAVFQGACRMDKLQEKSFQAQSTPNSPKPAVLPPPTTAKATNIPEKAVTPQATSDTFIKASNPQKMDPDQKK